MTDSMGDRDRREFIKNREDNPFASITVVETVHYNPVGKEKTAHLVGCDGKLPRFLIERHAKTVYRNHGIDVMDRGISVSRSHFLEEGDPKEDPRNYSVSSEYETLSREQWNSVKSEIDHENEDDG